MSSTVTPGVLAIVLITQLGSPRYRDRAEASQQLFELSPLVLPYLEAARQHQDMEVSQRSALIVTSYYGSIANDVAENMKPSGWPRLPWIDMLPEDHPDRRGVIDYYTQQAQRQIGRKGPPNWDEYRLATKLYLRELVLERQRPAELRTLLDRMATSEREWIIKNGSKYSPPLTVPK